jgi:hypothetical protein
MQGQTEERKREKFLTAKYGAHQVKILNKNSVEKLSRSIFGNKLIQGQIIIIKIIICLIK